MNAIRCRILSLLIVAGLVVPTMQAAGHACWGDACRLHRLAANSCDDAGDAVDPCCDTEDDEAGDDGCGTCDCICCGAPVITAVVRSMPTQVTIAPRAVTVAIRGSMLRPQDAVGAPLRPPQA